MVILAGSGGAFDGGFLTLVVVIVAIFAIALFAIFLKKNTFPILNLMIIRIFKGKYSFEYLEFFKKNDLRNPLNNCIKDEITLHISVFFKRLNGATNFTTEIPIEFKDVPFMTPYKKLVKDFGVPDCINIARFGQQRVKVVGYNETFQQKKMKSLFYFLEEEFFMGEFIFSETRRMDPTQVVEGISEKYLSGIPLESDTFYIEGPLGNALNYHDNGFYASVKYLYQGDSRINEILSKVFLLSGQKGQAFKQAMIQEESLNRF
ncbi:MAG: hypothetical protein IH596_07935 [Bacteroidales bacterium]|nr:hypothetical protein [Bacteroidales bacterium]